MALNKDEISKGIDALINDALAGKKNSLTSLVAAAKAKEEEAISSEARTLNGVTLSPSDLDAKAREHVLKEWSSRVKAEAISGKKDPEDMKSVIGLGKDVLDGNIIGIVISYITDKASYAASIMGAVKDFVTNRNGRDFTTILAEREQQRNFNKFAEKLGVDSEQLMAEIKNPPSTPIVSTEALEEAKKAAKEREIKTKAELDEEQKLIALEKKAREATALRTIKGDDKGKAEQQAKAEGDETNKPKAKGRKTSGENVSGGENVTLTSALNSPPSPTPATTGNRGTHLA